MKFYDTHETPRKNIDVMTAVSQKIKKAIDNNNKSSVNNEVVDEDKDKKKKKKRSEREGDGDEVITSKKSKKNKVILRPISKLRQNYSVYFSHDIVSVII